MTRRVTVVLNGADASMVSIITSKTVREESAVGKSFDLVKWIRARKLQWLGHILRMGRERKLKQALFVMFKERQAGDMLMDAPETSSWRELCTYACDRDYWRTRVRDLRQPRVTTVNIGSHHEAELTIPFTVST